MVFWSVEVDLCSLECNEVSCSDFEVSMGLVWFWAACLLVLRTVFLVWWRISMVCLALELVGSWMELGFSLGIETFV